CVNAPSPDQAVASSSNGMMNRHQPAENRVTPYVAEPPRFEQPRHRTRARILTNRRGYVSIRARIAMQHPTERPADNRQIREVRRADDDVRRTIEIERQHLAARRQDSR